MAEFPFDIRALFPQPIVRITSNMIPHTFQGDRRRSADVALKVSAIIDHLGYLSAKAQNLLSPITTAERLRTSENQTVYLLTDVNAGQKGFVIGLLKVGTKVLYVFDENGQSHKFEKAPCILDFYIHDTHQRTGLGKQLFTTMLKEENWSPAQCCVDRPSNKLLSFLKKHYGLEKTIPQANNFVVYQGFFDEINKAANPQSPNWGGQSSPEGRYVANRPERSMAEIMRSGPTSPKK